jgi:hypothetical protein
VERQTEQKILKILEKRKRKEFVKNEMGHARGFLKLALLEFMFIVGIVMIGLYIAKVLNPFIMGDSLVIRIIVGVGFLITFTILTKMFLKIHMWGCEKFGIDTWGEDD